MTTDRGRGPAAITITGYSDITRIGRGGLGDVYRATRDSTGGTVAIKVLRDVSDESVAWHRTRRELTALVSLAGHANVVQLIELLELPEGPALVMEFAPGGSVADMMERRDEPLSVGEAVFVGRSTATALVAAHAQGIVHRDVKPQNLLIDAYGQVKLCDFGIAAMARTEEFRTRTNAISMRYASPEDLDDEVDVGPPSDVYSLGATLLHIARGAPPTLKERLARWQPPHTDDPDLAALDRIMAACLHPTPADRPTASQVVDELERLGWALDERSRSLDAPDGEPATDDGPTDRRDRPSPPPGAPAAPAEAPREAAPPTPARRPAPVPAAAPAAPSLHDLAGRDRFAQPVPRTGDITVHRPDRRPPPRPAPAEPERKRSRRTIIGLALLLVLAVAAVVWWFARGGDDGVDTDGFRLVERPDGLLDVTEVEWPLGPAGECLLQVAGAPVLEVVPCTQPHDLQRIGVGELSSVAFPDDADFDEAAVRAVVRDECDATFRFFVGIDPDESELDAPFTSPSVETWPTGDRNYQCLAGVPDRRIVGDVMGAAR